MKNSIRSVVALVLSSAAGAHAQQLLTTDDGISLRGTVRLLQSNAATCNVIAENAQGSYEEMRANQGQPLHLWELEFSVFNGSGRALDHLIAYYDIASPWPPCTNWTENFQLEGEYVYEQVQWVDPSGRIQHTGAATPTLPNQTHTETILLLAFNGVRPQFADWSVNYTFMEGEAVALAAEAPVLSSATAGHARQPAALETAQQAAVVDFAETCAAVAHGAECWRELLSHPGCYVWDRYIDFRADMAVTWTGQCSRGFVEGHGTLTASWSEGGSTDNATRSYLIIQEVMIAFQSRL